jgi:hypothetical protein
MIIPETGNTHQFVKEGLSDGLNTLQQSFTGW